VRLRQTVRARLVVSVSIDGPPELNDRLRGVRQDFAHAIDTFAAVRVETGAGNTFVGMTLHGHKASCGRTTAELVQDTFAAINGALTQRRQAPIEWATLHLNIPHFSQHYFGNRASEAKDGFGGSVHRAEIAAALDAAAAKSRAGSSFTMRAIERVYRAEAQRYLATGRTGIACSALLSVAYLSEKGEVYPCTIWDKPLGNVRTTGYALMPIIEEARRAGVRRAVATGRCPNCWTPCEAYPSILASPFKSARAFAAGHASRFSPGPRVDPAGSTGDRAGSTTGRVCSEIAAEPLALLLVTKAPASSPPEATLPRPSPPAPNLPAQVP
jgi:hypothetical protein